jgi:hypothetical protein
VAVVVILADVVVVVVVVVKVVVVVVAVVVVVVDRSVVDVVVDGMISVVEDTVAEGLLIDAEVWSGASVANEQPPRHRQRAVRLASRETGFIEIILCDSFRQYNTQ